MMWNAFRIDANKLYDGFGTPEKLLAVELKKEFLKSDREVRIASIALLALPPALELFNRRFPIFPWPVRLIIDGAAIGVSLALHIISELEFPMPRLKRVLLEKGYTLSKEKGITLSNKLKFFNGDRELFVYLTDYAFLGITVKQKTLDQFGSFKLNGVEYVFCESNILDLYYLRVAHNREAPIPFDAIVHAIETFSKLDLKPVSILNDLSDYLYNHDRLSRYGLVSWEVNKSANRLTISARDKKLIVVEKVGKLGLYASKCFREVTFERYGDTWKFGTELDSEMESYPLLSHLGPSTPSPFFNQGSEAFFIGLVKAAIEALVAASKLDLEPSAPPPPEMLPALLEPTRRRPRDSGIQALKKWAEGAGILSKEKDIAVYSPINAVLNDKLSKVTYGVINRKDEAYPYIAIPVKTHRESRHAGHLLFVNIDEEGTSLMYFSQALELIPPFSIQGKEMGPFLSDSGNPLDLNIPSDLESLQSLYNYRLCVQDELVERKHQCLRLNWFSLSIIYPTLFYASKKGDFPYELYKGDRTDRK